MKRAPCARCETRSVQEDARVVHDPGVHAGLVAEHAAALRGFVVFEQMRRDHRCERADRPGFVLGAEVGAIGAATLPEMLGGLLEDPEAAAAVDTRPA